MNKLGKNNTGGGGGLDNTELWDEFGMHSENNITPLEDLSRGMKLSNLWFAKITQVAALRMDYKGQENRHGDQLGS